MQRQFRWFDTEDSEIRLLESATPASESPYRQKRSVTVLESSPSSSVSSVESDQDSKTKTITMADGVNINDENISLKEIVTYLQKIDRNVEKLTTSVAEVKGEIHDIRVENDKLKQNVEELKSENEYLHDKIHQLEFQVNLIAKQCHHNAQYSRRNNLRFFGIREVDGENVFDRIVDIVKSKLYINDFSHSEIDAAHRVGFPDKANPDDPKPRAIIVRFVRRTMRDRVIRSRKALAKSRMSITEDHTKQNLQLLNDAKKHVAVESAWSSEGRIMICIKESHKIVSIKSMSHLMEKVDEWKRWVNPKPKPRQNEEEKKEGDTPMLEEDASKDDETEMD